MGRLSLAVAGAAVLALGAGGGALAATALDGDDDRVVPIAQPAAPSPSASAGATAATETDVVVDDGIPAAEARGVARRAAGHAGGRAVSVDRDDGRYEVDVQRPDGAIVEVVLDGSRRVLGIDPGDADG
jgi:hypothetical protein